MNIPIELNNQRIDLRRLFLVIIEISCFQRVRCIILMVVDQTKENQKPVEQVRSKGMIYAINGRFFLQG